MMARYKIECCHNCPNRHPGCHSECESYKSQRAELDQTKAEILKKYDVVMGLNRELSDSIGRATKRINYRSKYRRWH